MPLKLITFDVTGTLLALRESVGHRYSMIGLRHGLNVPPNLLTKNFFSVFKTMLIEHPNFGESSIGWPEWWRQLVFRTFQDSLPEKDSVESSVLEKISSDLIEVYKTKECWKLAEGAQDLMDNLSRENVQLGVISNYDPRLEDILNDLDIRQYFNFVVTSYGVKCEKPDASIFKVVEDMNVDIKKEEMLHIGHNPKLDFIGAKNVGWNALLIAENFSDVHESFPNIEKEWVIRNICEVYQTLKSKNLLS